VRRISFDSALHRSKSRLCGGVEIRDSGEERLQWVGVESRRLYTLAMKVLVLYKPNSEHARKVEIFLHDLQKQHDVDQSSLKILDVDSREGIELAKIYDVMSTPAIIVTDNNGGYVNSWAGEELPLMRDVAAYSQM